MSENIELGRNSHIYLETKVLSVEKHYFTPKLSKAVVSTNGFGRFQIRNGVSIPWDRASLSNAGNGFPQWDLSPGIYLLSDVQNTGHRREDYLIYVSDEDIECCNTRGSLDDFVEKHFPDKIKDRDDEIRRAEKARELAQELYTICTEERESYEPETLDELDVKPEFLELPSVDEITRAIVERWIKGNELPREQFIEKYSAPSHYVILHPVFAKASTPEAAVADVKKKLQEREAAQAEAKKIAEASGLPELSGTPRQVSWAEQIRAKAQKRDPKNPALKRAKKAKYWIDRRNEYT